MYTNADPTAAPANSKTVWFSRLVLKDLVDGHPAWSSRYNPESRRPSDPIADFVRSRNLSYALRRGHLADSVEAADNGACAGGIQLGSGRKLVAEVRARGARAGEVAKRMGVTPSSA